MDSKKAICMIVGILLLLVIGFIVIPPLLKKAGSRLYKNSLKKEEIDFEELGPKIVKIEDAGKRDGLKGSLEEKEEEGDGIH